MSPFCLRVSHVTARTQQTHAGDLLNKYLYLSGRVNMRAIEVTIQNLIGSGMNPQDREQPLPRLCLHIVPRTSHKG